MNEHQPELSPEVLEAARRALERLAEGKECPICGASIEKKEQIGRSIYLRPCGHRYQGQLPKEEGNEP